MTLLISIALVLVWQAALIGLFHFGEVDRFWFIVLECVSVPASFVGLMMGWAASLDWSK